MTRASSTVLTVVAAIAVLFGCSMISQTTEGIKAIYGNSQASSDLYYHVTHGPRSALPTSVLFKPNSISSESAFQDWASSDLEIDLVRSGDARESDEEYHVRYQQIYQGIPVEGGVYTAHFENDNVWSATGQIYSDIDLRIRPRLTVDETVNLLQSENSNWRIVDTSTLIVLPIYVNDETEYRLAYRTGILDTEAGGAANVYTDANQYSVVRVEPLMLPVVPTGTGTTSEGTTVSFETQHTSEIPPDTSAIVIEDIRTGYRLMDTQRNLHTKSSGGTSMSDEYTFNPQDDGTTTWTGWDWAIGSHEVIEDDNEWTDSPAAVDAHWGMQVAYDYYRDVHGRTGFDGNNTYFQALVDYDQGMVNAFYYIYLPGILFGDGGSYGRPMTVLDIVAHEFTHAVETSITNLNYYEESGSLKEGIADVFMTDIKFRMGRGNWQLAPEVFGPNVRSFEDPNASDSPDTFEGRFFGEYSSAFGRSLGLRDLQQHQNSTVMSHWFYLVSEGGEGENDNEDHYDIEPIGREEMIAVVYKSLFYLHPNATFMDMRKATTSIIQRQYGKCSDELKQVTNAWNAVGVGDPYCDCFEGTFTGVFETRDGTTEMKYYFKKDKYAVEIKDSDGTPRILYTSSTDPYHHVQGYEDISASSPEGLFFKNLFQGKIPLFVQQEPTMSRKEYLQYRNSSRTGNVRQEGEYTVYEYRLQEATIWATEEVCLSYADLAGTIGAIGPPASGHVRQMFFGFPTVFSVPGEGTIRAINIREHEVSDSYFEG